MSYNSAIPQAASKRVISQKQIAANFTEIFAAFAKNHSPLGNTDLQGKHNILILRIQALDPATTSTQNAIYNKSVATFPSATLIPNLFFRPNNSQTPIQMTYPSIGTSSAPTYAANQYSFLAGPFVVYTGVLINPADGTVVNVLPATRLRYVGLGVQNFETGSAIVSTHAIPTAIAANSFTIRFQTSPGSKRNIYYLAIGN